MIEQQSINLNNTGTEAGAMLKYNRLWYVADRFEKRLLEQKLANPEITKKLDVDQNIKKAAKLKNYCINKLRFSKLATFIQYEALILGNEPTILGLQKHYNIAKGCRPRLDFINSSYNLWEQPGDTKLRSILLDPDFLALTHNVDFINLWTQYELIDQPKWSSYQY